MAGAKLDIAVTCGRDFYISLTNQTSLGNPWDLRGYVTWMTVKASINDPDASALFSSGPYASDLGFGKVSFKLPHETTINWWTAGTGPVSANAVYDIAYSDVNHNFSTVLSGVVTLLQSVTISIPGG